MKRERSVHSPTRSKESKNAVAGQTKRKLRSLKLQKKRRSSRLKVMIAMRLVAVMTVLSDMLQK